ncbi:MAG: ParB/RepB/Spo0J family partition protein [Hydrogenophaga sp.]|uniref:ParB/RepB/Spo0J family partition protein n=1 Tax=Hydrogenophaga sp. TaxID=1904254 RepID=UPI0027332ADB|nr:ParB/RepB/Spo0J family partition protein [Hydrogenophaga sp.]MDP3625044.1 ParB/RepB/Spo0J family partition protein [Hydrogenophaga sp.]
MNTELIQIAPSLIAPSLTNPRKTFNPERLAELAESIKASGVHSPLLLRPLPADRLQDTFTNRTEGAVLPTYELVTGERRLRASIMAEQETIPALVRALTDDEVLEIQIIENLQRDDLSELEEAEGYEMLMHHGLDGHTLTAEQVGAKIGKGRSYVYNRLKLLDLCPEARDAMRAGKMDASKGLLVARIPDHKLQIKALKAFTEPNGYSGDTMSVRAAVDWLRKNVMLKLSDAVFSIKDAKLVPGAGSCTDCPKRTGANPELFSDIDSPDVCTDVKCFQVKIDAHTDKVVEKARAKGIEVIAGKEAKEMKPNSWSDPSGMSDVDRTVWVHQEGKDPKQVSLRSALTKDELNAHIKGFLDPHSNKLIEIIPKDLANIAQERLQTSTKPKADDKELIARRQAEAAKAIEQDYHGRWRIAALQAIEPRVIRGEIKQFEGPMLEGILQWMLDEPDYDALERAVDKPDLDDYDALEFEIKVLPQERAGMTILRALLWREIEVNWGYNNGARVLKLDTPIIDACAEVLGIDLDPIKEAVKAEIREEQEEKARAEAEKAAQALVPASQTSGDGGSKAKTSKPASKAKKSKTTPEEAMKGIAAAMQSGEESAASTAEDSGAAGAAQDNEGKADDGRADHGGKGAPIMGWSIGQKVRFREGLKSAGGKNRKVSGRAGEISSVVSPGRYMVKFGPAAHEVASANANELEEADVGLGEDAGKSDDLPTTRHPHLAWPFPKNRDSAGAAT